MKNQYTQRKINKVSEISQECEYPVWTVFLVSCLDDLHDKSISNLPYTKWNTNVSRVSKQKVMTSINNIVKKNLHKTMGYSYKDNVDETLTRYVMNGYLVSKNTHPQETIYINNEELQYE